MKNSAFCKNIILVIFFIVELIHSRKVCGYDYLKTPKRILVKQSNENKRILQEDKWDPIRIHLDYSYIENNVGRISKADLIALRDRIMPKTQEIFQSLLNVKRIQHKLKLMAPSCETFPIPEKYHQDGEGVDADLIIFVLIDETGFFSENRIEAAAIHCLQHSETRRPIAGYIQFKPDLQVQNTTALDYMTWLAVHEISHILAINDALYEDYIDSNLIPLGYNRVIGKKTVNEKKINYIKTPKVLEKSRKHFGCDHLDGVPLEYNGGPGTAGAHWSKKYMNTDYMIGDSYGENLISEITLALFEDSGWYKVEDKANLFLWGKDKGCDFFEKKCIKTINSDSGKSSENKISTLFPNEFCTKLNYPVCSNSNIFKGICRARKYPADLVLSERYFSDPKIGGIDPLTDKCPIAVEEKGDQNYYGGSCRVGDLNNQITKLEKICPECSCFLSTLDFIDDRSSNNLRFKQKPVNEQPKIESTESVIIDANVKKENTTRIDSAMKKPFFDSDNYYNPRPEYTRQDAMAMCFEYKCNGSELSVLIEGKLYGCPSNKYLTIKGYTGNILCPENGHICNKKYKCKFGCTDYYENSKGFAKFQN